LKVKAVGRDDGTGNPSAVLALRTGSFYGFLFSVPGQAEGLGQVQGGAVRTIKQLGVIASMQGVHTISDGPWVAKRLGEAGVEWMEATGQAALLDYSAEDGFTARVAEPAAVHRLVLHLRIPVASKRPVGGSGRS